MHEEVRDEVVLRFEFQRDGEGVQRGGEGGEVEVEVLEGSGGERGFEWHSGHYACLRNEYGGSIEGGRKGFDGGGDGSYICV